MSEPTILVALRTYGTQVQRGVTCIKCVNGVPSILMKLFGEKATNMTPQRASYSYIHVPGARLNHHFLVLKVTDAEKAQIEERVCHSENMPCVFLWKDGEWYEFPCKRHPEYRLASTVSRSYPRFRADSVHSLSPSAPVQTVPERPSAGQIAIKRSQRVAGGPVWWWISGATEAHRATLERAGARLSRKRHQYYYIGDTLPEAILALQAPAASAPAGALSQAEDVISEAFHNTHAVAADNEGPGTASFVGENDGQQAAATDGAPREDKTKETGIRILKSQGLPTEGIEPDAIQQAVERLKDSVPSTTAVPNTKGLASIGQRYVGELTGDITGNVHCYGYAVHDGVLIYLNLGGPHTAVEAIRAKLGKGEAVNLIPWDGPAVELTAGEGKTGMYTDFMQKIPEARFTTLILAHKLFTEPNYAGKSTTFILRASAEQA